MDNVLLAFGLTVFAGLSTGIGSAIAFFAKTTSKKFLSISLGFSAGVMIYVSMIEIFFKAQDSLIAALGEKNGSWTTIAGFFGGMAVIALIDKMIPSHENPHEVRNVEDMQIQNEPEDVREYCQKIANKDKSEKINASREVQAEEYDEKDKQKLMRMGVFTALAITIHNFPEGLATFASALHDPSLGIAIAIAVAIHNIPEGIAVSVPIYFATGSKKKAFMYSFLSGLSEPVGAIVGYTILRPFFNDVTFGILFAAVAGIMVFISFDELLPSAREYGEHHLSRYGLIGGMAVMAVSLVLFM